MPLKPWYKVVTPREDLREGKPLDASEFAVHLDQVREGCAPADYQKPERFFERTYLTKNLASLAAEVIRRLSGEKTETNAVFNLSTQFDGGKTHALTLLYHLAWNGSAANEWAGVPSLLARAGIAGVPKAAAAVFVGTEFDSITGRGGKGGTPLRKTPWGEIAFQLGGERAFAIIADHDKKGEAPGGEVIRQFLPKEKPSLILMDELMNYVSLKASAFRSSPGGSGYRQPRLQGQFMPDTDDLARSILPVERPGRARHDHATHEQAVQLFVFSSWLCVLSQMFITHSGGSAICKDGGSLVASMQLSSDARSKSNRSQTEVQQARLPASTEPLTRCQNPLPALD